MALIKFLLLAGVALFGVLALRGGNSAAHRAFWRIGGIVVVVAAGLSVIFPNSLTAIAEFFGVDRGTDLLLYFMVVAFMLVVVILFRRISELEQRHVSLVRRIALAETAREDESGVEDGT